MERVKIANIEYEVRKTVYCGECKSDAEFARTEEIGSRHYAIYKCLKGYKGREHLFRARLNP